MSSPFSTDAAVLALFRENLLQAMFKGPLYPELLYRGLYESQEWGEQALSVWKTAHGPMAGKAVKRQFKQDPIPGSYSNEFWPAEIAEYTDALDTDKFAAGLSVLDLYKKDIEALGMGAGSTLQILARFPAYNNAVAGQTLVTTAASGTSKDVLRLNGFTRAFDSSGKYSPVSASNPLTVYLWTGSAWAANTVVNYTPSVAGDEFGPGNLTLGTSAVTTSRQPLVAATASYRVIEGGGYSVDDISSADTLTGDSLIAAAARLRDLSVPRFADGLYHCHLSPAAMRQLLADPQVQLLSRGMGFKAQDIANPYVTGQVPVFSGIALIENTEAPNSGTVPSTYGDNGDLIAVETANATVPLETTLVVGAGGGIEYWREPLKSMRRSGAEVGMIGNWSMIGGSGMVTDVDHIEIAVRAPINRLLDVESLAYSYTGTFSWRTDYRSKKAGAAYPTLPSTARAAYKRAVPVIHYGG